MRELLESATPITTGVNDFIRPVDLRLALKGGWERARNLSRPLSTVFAEARIGNKYPAHRDGLFVLPPSQQHNMPFGPFPPDA